MENNTHCCKGGVVHLTSYVIRAIFSGTHRPDTQVGGRKGEMQMQNHEEIAVAIKKIRSKSTAELAEYHRRLDEAIAKRKPCLPDGISTELGKQVKCEVKNILTQKARVGDAVARAYAHKRGWPLAKSVTRDITERIAFL